ncbi:MAG: hypothetical protein ACREBU_06330 [Nitrososphaera sp.]
MIEILEVPAILTSEFYPQIQPLVARTLKYIRGEYDEAYVKEGLSNGQIILCIASVDGKLTGMSLLCQEVYPGFPILRILQVAGRHKKQWEWPMYEHIQSVAKRLECHRIEAAGRKGWATTAKEFGFTAYHITYIKDLTNGFKIR